MIIELALSSLLGFGSISVAYVLLRHLIISVFTLRVDWTIDKMALEKGLTTQMRSPSFYTALTFSRFFNLAYSLRADGKYAENDFVTIHFDTFIPRAEYRPENIKANW